MNKEARSEFTANEWMAEAAKHNFVPNTRVIPSWQVASTCKRSKRNARGISITKRVARFLGL